MPKHCTVRSVLKYLDFQYFSVINSNYNDNDLSIDWGNIILNNDNHSFITVSFINESLIRTLFRSIAVLTVIFSISTSLLHNTFICCRRRRRRRQHNMITLVIGRINS